MVKKRSIDSVRTKKRTIDFERDLHDIDSRLRELDGLPSLPVYKPEDFSKPKKKKIKKPKIKITKSRKIDLKKQSFSKKPIKKIKINPKEISKKKIKEKPLKKTKTFEVKKLIKKSKIKRISEKKLHQIFKKRKRDLGFEKEPVRKEDSELPTKEELEEVLGKNKTKKIEIEDKSKEKKSKVGFPSYEKDSKLGKEKITKDKIKKDVHDQISKSVKPLGRYETPFDGLLRIIDEKKVIPVDEVVKKFKVDKKIVLEWGRILEESGLLDFHIPTFGESEFRKKGFVPEKKIRKKPSKKKIFIVTGVILVVIWVVILILVFRPEPEIPEIESETILDEGVEVLEGAEQVSIERAFSGEGGYDCTDQDNEKRYIILDELIKIETIDGGSQVIIKNNKTYTLNVDTWIEGEVPSGAALPGSGKLPSIILICKEVEIEESEFNT